MKEPWKKLVALFAVAWLLRLAYAALNLPVPLQDTPDYDELALNVLSGTGFVSHDNWHGFAMYSWRPPFYSFFLAAIYGLWGYSHTAIQVIQAGVGGATVVLVWLLARRFCPAAAWPAALFATVYEPLVSISSEIMSECLFTFWVLLALWALGDEKRRWNYIAAGGAAVALAALTRPVGLLLLPAFAFSALLAQGRTAWRSVLWSVVVTLVVIAPWTVRNYMVHGALVPISTHGGFIIARSNSAAPAWRQERGWGIDREVFERMPTEVERDRFWLRQGREFIASNPGVYLRLVGERFLRFWYVFKPSYNFWFALLLPFFAAGLWRNSRRPIFLFPNVFIALSTLVFCAILYGSTRFRLPLEPLFIVYAAVFLTNAWDRWARSRFYSVVAVALFSNMFVWWNEEALRGVVLAGLDGMGLR
jgi:4-amino-4-deoxy-L-arabinose transferase-like glycosyltransferase